MSMKQFWLFVFTFFLTSWFFPQYAYAENRIIKLPLNPKLTIAKSASSNCLSAAEFPNASAGVAWIDLDPAAATKFCAEALKVQPDNTHLVAVTARAMMKNGQSDEARSLLKRFSNSKDPWIHTLLGLTFENRFGDVDYARAYKQYLIAARYGSAIALNRLAILQESGGVGRFSRNC
jgi:predicted Zn-dependent protease